MLPPTPATAWCAAGYMLENPSIRALLVGLSHPPRRVVGMSGSENADGAENQQERLMTNEWVVGFVDGEGCFSCPIYRCRTMTLGWQVRPEFAVVQGASSRDVLEGLVRFFGCGKVFRNRRHDNHREDIFRYCVQRFGDLRDIIVPFFQESPLRTAKRHNFAKFAEIIAMMDRRRHLSVSGLIEIAEVAETMNFRKPSEVVRILRDHTPALFGMSSEEDEMVRTLRRRRETGGNVQSANQGVVPLIGLQVTDSSEIPCRVSSDLHEWRNDFTTVSTTDPAKLKSE